MERLRQIIKEHIKMLFLEMVERPDRHFSDRVFQRLMGPYTDFPGPFEGFEKQVFDNIEFLKKLTIKYGDYPPRIQITMKAPMVYTATKPEVNSGDRLWFIAIGNELQTFFLSRNDYKPGGVVSLRIDMDKLKDYIKKKGENVLDMNDIRILNQKQIQPKTSIRQDEKMVIINGTKFIVDPENEIVYKKNDPKVKYNVWDVIEGKIENLSIEDKSKDKILDYLL